MQKQELLREIEQRSTTLDLGIYDRDTGKRHSLLGTIGQALTEAAQKAKEQPVKCPHCGAPDSAKDDWGVVYCDVCHYLVEQ